MIRVTLPLTSEIDPRHAEFLARTVGHLAGRCPRVHVITIAGPDHWQIEGGTEDDRAEIEELLRQLWECEG
jgi:hypothetical protein